MYKLVKLKPNNLEPFSLINDINSNENEFKNTAFGKDLNQFKEWLVEQNNWSKGQGLPAGFVPQIIYWFYVDNVPVGMGKIRLRLNNDSREVGGNVGYAIGKPFRGKGYGTVFLSLLISKAKRLNILEIMLTVEKTNPISRHIVEKVGGQMVKETNERWYFSF